MENYKELMSIARSESGLDDFGSDTFLEGLELLTADLESKANLNAIGEHVIRSRILEHLKQRLQIEDWYRRHPEIDEVEIKAPLIGISLPRTGSTALSFLLAQDPNARSLLRWEATHPCPPPSTVKGLDPRVEAEWKASQATGLKSHTPTGISSPAECQDLMALDFKSQIFLAFAQVPNYGEWLLNADLSSTYHYEKRALKLLQWGCPNKPWRIKAPSHLLYLDHLVKAFPDARFVMTHRDPADVILSVINVYYDIVSNFSDTADKEYIAQLNINMWPEGMRRTLALRQDPEFNSRFYDIHFRAMHKDPISEVRGLYEWLGETVSTEFEQNMETFWKKNSENREPNAKRPAEEFGFDPEQVRPEFAEYTRKMAEWVTVPE